jgi:hypothetical protein
MATVHNTFSFTISSFALQYKNFLLNEGWKAFLKLPVTAFMLVSDSLVWSLIALRQAKAFVTGWYTFSVASYCTTGIDLQFVKEQHQCT